MKSKVFTAIAVVAVVTLISGASILATASPATSSDPLITLSYLNGPFRAIINQDINAAWNSVFTRIGDAESRITGELQTARSQTGKVFTVKTISSGKSQSFPSGSEIMLSSGTVNFNGNLTKTSGTPTQEASGSLLINNMYLATGSVTLTAVDGSARVWVRAS